MKRLVLVAAFATTSFSAIAGEPAQQFLSWYNGWTVHTVWGIGKVSGGYVGTSVTCGSTIIPVRPIYDSHASRQPPEPEQTQEFSRAANLALLQKIEFIAGKCNFEPSDEA